VHEHHEKVAPQVIEHAGWGSEGGGGGGDGWSQDAGGWESIQVPVVVKPEATV